ncbi:MAG: hypothetical protein QN160_02505 [Armatimonadota bacterium]|nr:hypothetical protein [Armatimonadota bacterium]
MRVRCSRIARPRSLLVPVLLAGLLVTGGLSVRAGAARPAEVPIRGVIIDEAGGADRQMAELRRLALDERVDLVIG